MTADRTSHPMDAKLQQLDFLVKSSSQFPSRLVLLLKDPEAEGIIQFNPNTRSLILLTSNIHTSPVFQRYFQDIQMDSFIRQLNAYGFNKNKKDFEHESYFHPTFNINDPNTFNIKRNSFHANARSKDPARHHRVSRKQEKDDQTKPERKKQRRAFDTPPCQSPVKEESVHVSQSITQPQDAPLDTNTLAGIQQNLEELKANIAQFQSLLEAILQGQNLLADRIKAAVDPLTPVNLAFVDKECLLPNTAEYQG